VENLPRRGYRFTAPVEEEIERPADDAPAAKPTSTALPPNHRRIFVLVLTCITGRREEPEKVLKPLLVLGKERYVPAYSLAIFHAALGAKRDASSI
jgi:hypothetical protein